MCFQTILKETVWLLLTEKRVSYQRLRVQFNLDDAHLEALRHELVQVKRWATDQGGTVLAWAGAEADRDAVSDVGAGPALTPLAGSKELEKLPEAKAEPSSNLTHSPSDHSAGDAERRPLTVMFCDLADSTALSTKLDPEDLQDIIRTYQERSTELIQEYEGFVAKYMGDGILVYFGYPKSLERNAERAVRSGLSIIEAMADLNHTLGREKGIEIAVRIGISTGVVIVGEVVGEGLAQERTVIGEAPNVAARLQGLARRNGIVIGSLTRELAGDAFDYEDLGGQDLKGIEGKVLAWGVLGLRGESAEEADAQGEDDLTKVPVLIGRDEETGLLRRAWQSTKDEGFGQIVTLSGEAGIGKSVLIDGLSAQVRAEGLPRVTFRCSPYHTGSALHPVIEHFKRLAGWQPDDPIDVRLTKLKKLLAHYEQPLVETVPLIAGLMSLLVPENQYPQPDLSPQQQKQQTQDTIIAMTMEEAERQPHLQIWEDLHWADPSTLELLGLLIDQAPTAPLLIILTARPEFVPPWPGRSHNTPITLNRLERSSTEALIARIAAKPLPKEVLDHIVAKTDGVPLYIEELTKTILASDILRDTSDRFELAGPLASLSIPETLQESLMARLDRLPQVREIAQIGSVLGREFAYEMISGLSPIKDDALQEGLGQLVDAELLYQRGRPPRAKYIFKHALVQDAAYDSILKRARQHYHGQFAELLEARFPETVEASPELLAHHHTEAGNAEQAVTLWRAAGQRAVERSANIEAVAHLTRGIDILRELPRDKNTSSLELDMQISLGSARIAARGYSSVETEEAYVRGRELIEEIGNDPRQFAVLHGLSMVYWNRAQQQQNLEVAEDMLERAERQNETLPKLVAHRVMAVALNPMAQFEKALNHAEQAEKLYDPERQRGTAHQYGHDMGVGLYWHLSIARLFLGYLGSSAEAASQASALTREVQNANTTMYNSLWAAFTSLVRSDWPSAREIASTMIEDALSRSMALWVVFGRHLLGSALANLDQPDAALEEIYRGRNEAEQLNHAIFKPMTLRFEARALTDLDRYDEAIARLDEALEIIEGTEERWWEAEVHRAWGHINTRRAGDPIDSQASFQRAIDVARRQKAKLFELRAATSLANLWHSRGRTAEAYELLAPVHNWFSEGADTMDLRRSMALLNKLSQAGHQQNGAIVNVKS